MDILKSIKRKLFMPKVLKEKVVVGSMNPRNAGYLREEGIPLVYRINCSNYLNQEFLKIEHIWEEKYSNLFTHQCRVLIKINLNTQDPYPASTSPDILLETINLLRKNGVKHIIVGDCSSISSLPTINIAKKTGILDIIKGRAEFICFDKAEWVSVPVKGKYLKEVTVPRIAIEADRIISIANLKTHRIADFSLSLKLGVGFMHPLERYSLHREHLHEMAVEVNLAVPPDMAIVDGRKAFIDGGPEKGRTEDASIILFGTNLLAVDVEACKTLYELKAVYGCVNGFPADPFETAQLKHARDICIGGAIWKGYNAINL